MKPSDGLSPTDTVASSETALSTTLDGEAVILETESGTYYGLNEVATHVWERLDEQQTIADLRDSVLAEYDVEQERVEHDLEAVLADMAENGLVEIGRE